MKVKWCYLLLFLLQPIFTNGQYTNVWAFGDGAGIDFNAAVPVAINTAMDTYEAAASVCDNNGQLLFYTNGSKIWDRTHNLMPNGNNLTSLTLTASAITHSTSQGTVIIPIPQSNSLYYVFSLTGVETGTSLGRLYYSIVDMNLNNGLGDIVDTAKGILIDSNLTEHMTAVAGTRCNAWLLTVSRTQNQLKAYNVTSSGIALPVLSDLLSVNRYLNLGELCVSEDGKKLAIARAGLGLYDFDVSTGIASNSMILDNFSALHQYYSCAFSPDNTKVYATQSWSGGDIYQYDLSSDNAQTIINSKSFIGTVYVSSMKLAPDGKIYISRGAIGYLSAINAPNLPGSACDLVNNALQLTTDGSYSGIGFPNAVPMILSDTFLTSQHQSAGCYSSQPVMLSHSVPNSWDIQWEDGNSALSRSITDSGTYWISYYTPPCNFHTDTFHVIFPRMELSVSPMDTTIRYGDSILLEASGADYYTWWPSSGFPGHNTIAQPWVKPPRSVVYTVVGTNRYGCRDSATVTIDVDYDIPLLIPNAFSPNGDGINDEFKIATLLPGQENIDLQIFNRWGVKIFESHSLHKGWNGRINGSPADIGVYYYRLRFNFPDGTSRMFKGDITLVR